MLSAFERYRLWRVSKSEVYRLNAEAGRGVGFLPGTLGDKMAPWAKPVIDNLDGIIRRMGNGSRFSRSVANPHGERGAGNGNGGGPSATVEDLLARNILEIAPIGATAPRSTPWRTASYRWWCAARGSRRSRRVASVW